MSSYQQELDATGILKFSEGIHNIGTLSPRDGCIIEGAGMHRTILKGSINGMASDVTVWDLSLDCVGNRLGIVLYGTKNSVENCHIFNHSNPPGEESFAILLSSVGPPSKDNLVSRCLVTDFHGNYNGGIVIASQKVEMTGSIEDCMIVSSSAMNHANMLVGMIGASNVENCISINPDIGIYTEGLLPYMDIRNCHFIGVKQAALLMSLKLPQPELVFEKNHVELDDAIAIRTSSEANTLTKGLIVRDNTITGTGHFCAIHGYPKVVMEGNRFPASLKGSMTECGGKLRDNRTLDGKWKLRDGPPRRYKLVKA